MELPIRVIYADSTSTPTTTINLHKTQLVSTTSIVNSVIEAGSALSGLNSSKLHSHAATAAEFQFSDKNTIQHLYDSGGFFMVYKLENNESDRNKELLDVVQFQDLLNKENLMKKDQEIDKLKGNVVKVQKLYSNCLSQLQTKECSGCANLRLKIVGLEEENVKLKGKIVGLEEENVKLKENIAKLKAEFKKDIDFIKNELDSQKLAVRRSNNLVLGICIHKAKEMRINGATGLSTDDETFIMTKSKLIDNKNRAAHEDDVRSAIKQLFPNADEKRDRICRIFKFVYNQEVDQDCDNGDEDWFT